MKDGVPRNDVCWQCEHRRACPIGIEIVGYTHELNYWCEDTRPTADRWIHVTMAILMESLNIRDKMGCRGEIRVGDEVIHGTFHQHVGKVAATKDLFGGTHLQFDNTGLYAWADDVEILS